LRGGGAPVDNDVVQLTLVGHSTVLIECGGTRLLTDPFFSAFGSMVQVRVAPPGLGRDEVGRIDGVLVSHRHWDHTDRRFFRALDPAVPVLVPPGSALAMRLRGVRKPTPLEPWRTVEIGDALITAVPAEHAARALGYVVEAAGCCVYFAGDTFHSRFMAEIGARFAIDAALIPVVAHRFATTMGERSAVDAVRDLRPRTVIPIHLGVRPRNWLLRSRQSAKGFERRLREAGLKTRVAHLAEGASWEISTRRVAPGDVPTAGP
jgi:L-ascorbate metabolism protein UlaG (beta-lactamase superfamily)